MAPPLYFFASIPKAQIVPLVVGSHVALTFLSIFNSQLLPAKVEMSDDTEECFDANHYGMVKDFVSRMYNGGGDDDDFDTSNGLHQMKKGSITGYNYNSNIRSINLSSTASFEDPAAVCRGIDEIKEAFRALKLLHPTCISPPKCIDVQPQGDSIMISLALHQQYTIPVYGPLTLRSILEVPVQLKQLKEIPESELLIIKMKELWNGKPMAWPNIVYYPGRRLNGIVSYHLTSWFL
jgi:hypothetical protein